MVKGTFHGGGGGPEKVYYETVRIVKENDDGL
jgi:hypothetical protein